MSSILSFATLLSIAAPALAATHAVNIPSGFHSGTQHGIGSWFQAKSDQDVTNGVSWCGYPYSNSDPLISVPIQSMGGKTYYTDKEAWKAATQKFCGLEAKVTDPKTGRSKLMYIGDGFDMKFVRSPGSLDIMLESFIELHGDPKGVKDDVIKNLTWELTGNRNPKYAAPGTVDPPVENPTKPSESPSKPSENPTTPSESPKEPEQSNDDQYHHDASPPAKSESPKAPADTSYTKQGSSMTREKNPQESSSATKDQTPKEPSSATKDNSPAESSPAPKDESPKPKEDDCEDNKDEASNDNNDNDSEDNANDDNSEDDTEDDTHEDNYQKRQTSENVQDYGKCRGNPRKCRA